jgi:dolichol kinase
LLFPKFIALTAITVLTFGDAASTIIGLKFGKIKFKGKTIEGFIAGTIISFIPVYLILGNPFLALIASFIGMLAELILPIDDSLTIPLSVGIVLLLII